MQTDLITSKKDFDSLEKAWKSLLEMSGSHSVFQTFEWLRTWWAHLGANSRLAIVTVHDGVELVGIAPLMITKKHSLRYLSFISSGLADFEEFIFVSDEREEAILEAVLSTISKLQGWDIFRLQCIRNGSRTNQVLRKLIAERFRGRFEHFMHQEKTAFIRTSITKDEYFKKLKSKFLADTRRRRALLEKEGVLRLVDYSAGGEESARALESHFDLHRTRRHELNMASVFDDPKICDFFREVSCLFAAKGWLKFHALMLDETCCASHLGFSYQKRFYYYLPAFMESYKRFAVSRLLLFNLLEAAFDSQFDYFDFTLGEESYKNDFEPEFEELSFVNAYPQGFHGMLSRFIFGKGVFFAKKVLGKKW